MNHELKILPEYFEAVASGKKKFEIRKDDRNYQVGDLLVLKEYKDGEYTGRTIRMGVSYIYRGSGEYGLQEGYCILSLFP